MNQRPRHLRGDIPLTRKSTLSVAPDEDRELTRYLTRALKDARSTSLRPPACPYCGNRVATLVSRSHARLPMPAFRCASCSKTFNRLTGTPLARLRHADKLYAFARLLSSQMSYKEAAEILHVDYSAIANWARKLRTWLMQLDPTGAWESRVRLGIKPRPIVDCPQCGKNTAIRFFGFVDDGRTRRLSCGFCRMTFRVPKDKVGRYEVKTAVAYDPTKTRTKETAAHKKRR